MPEETIMKPRTEISLAIISTTIHDEGGYLPYDALATKSKFGSVKFYIAADLKTAPFDVTKFTSRVEYLTPDVQEKFYSSEHIGWDTSARRNIALLKALQDKPDFILSINDDHVPDEHYFDAWFDVLTKPAVLTAEHSPGEGVDQWHNYLESADTPITFYPRGFPVEFRGKKTTHVKKTSIILPDRIGFWQSLFVGDPDIDAMARITYPMKEPVKDIKDKNYVLKNVWSAYGASNIVFSRKLFPLAFVWPKCGRFSDVYASFVWQKFLWNNDMYAHVGDPVHTHKRPSRDVLGDLNDEVEGYFHARAVWEHVNTIIEPDPMKFLKNLTFSESAIMQRINPFLDAYIKDLGNVLV